MGQNKTVGNRTTPTTMVMPVTTLTPSTTTQATPTPSMTTMTMMLTPSMTIALILISSYMVAEVIGGVISGSLALLADAGHMLTDAASIVMALVAMWLGGRAASAERTFGYYRTEVLAAMANAFGLWVIASWILIEAYHRAFTENVHVDGLPVLIVGFGGLLV